MKDTTQQQLDLLRARIVRDGVCPHLAETAKHLVFGEGSASADIVFVGEAPGKTEDETGRPFVGAAGRFLNELLEGIGLEREDVYITSILKYRPPNNRDPKPDEKAAFWPYLQAQLEIIGPKLVVTLGRHSTNSFLPDLQISKAHGKLQRWAGPVGPSFPHGAHSVPLRGGRPRAATRQVLSILPLYHPAAALYNNNMRQTLIDDFAQIQQLARIRT